jgi:hypothetical protein
MEHPDQYDLEYGMAVAFRLEVIERLQRRLKRYEEQERRRKEKNDGG